MTKKATKKKKSPRTATARNKRVRNSKRATRTQKSVPTKLDAVVAALPPMPLAADVPVSLAHPIKSVRKLIDKVTRKAKATVKSTRARVSKKKPMRKSA